MSVTMSSVGTLYIPNYHGIAWSQPGGQGTQVLPAQANGPWAAYPVPGQFFEEAGQSLWRSGCQHGNDAWHVSIDYDESTQMQAAVIYCPLCSFIVQVIEPASMYYDVTVYPIVVG